MVSYHKVAVIYCSEAVFSIGFMEFVFKTFTHNDFVDKDMHIKLNSVLICSSTFWENNKFETIKVKACLEANKKRDEQTFPKLKPPSKLCANTSFTLHPHSLF